ncbi:hypothetical protein SLEP1_g35052 [Rubroshorea leprosula]|uniref:Uncharacterized protein n=1 Tax=Rubroshorea leprosula TaxID=152421 RepID=A0AAV5KLZ6_9ROSI|nr:hypothetical protein SLEP1_g35052 [Rubroshorea leprosula]
MLDALAVVLLALFNFVYLIGGQGYYVNDGNYIGSNPILIGVTAPNHGSISLVATPTMSLDARS